MIIELLCTLTGIIAGVAIVASLVRQQGERARFKAEEKNVDANRIQGIAQQLQTISKKVAANVTAHSESIGRFNGQLSESGDDPTAEINSKISQMIAANEAMQNQLADAQARIAKQTQMIEQASKQARTDALTGLANRRALDEYLSNSIDSIDPDDHVALMLMDIDHFKNFNDSFGHTTGDAVLASFARAINDCCDADCYSARFGGEEFAVIIEAANNFELIEKAAKLRKYVSEQVISYEDLQLKITASAGLCFLATGEKTNNVYERADEGLYKSKKAGRNRGYWLDDSNWIEFPDVSEETEEENSDEAAQAEAKAEAKKKAEAAKLASAASDKSGDTLAAIMSEFGGEDRQNKEAITSFGDDARVKTDDSGLEILDLKSFLGQVDEKIGQLRRGDLTATGIMVEAIGLQDADAEEAASSWEHTVALIQINLRGIDVVCQFRPFTLCIFVPGCAEDTAVERAATIQASLPAARDEWPEVVCPSRLAISIAQIDTTEKPSAFLDRMEMALDEAAAAAESEVVVHTGDGCRFQAV